MATPTTPVKVKAVVLIPAMPLVPVPLRPMLCGLPITESLNMRVALRKPFAVGMKITETAQFAPAAKDEPQVVEI